MSAHQGNSPCRITVTTSDADVLRLEAKKVLMYKHEGFEDFVYHVPVKQLAQADIFRDATAVIDALGWDPALNPPRKTFTVPLTSGHVEQLYDCRRELLDHNRDLLGEMGDDQDDNAIITSDIHNNHHSIEALNRIFDAYNKKIRT